MALCAADAAEMEAAAKKAGKLLQVGFVRRFGNDAAAFREFSDAGLIGRLYYAKATYFRRSGCPGGWFGDKAYSGGGPLIDLGVHVIDLVRYLAGNPRPISVYGVTDSSLGMDRAVGAKKEWGNPGGKDFRYNVEDFASAMIRFEGGLTLSIECSFNLNCKDDSAEIMLYGTEGGARFSPEAEFYTQTAGRFVNLQPAAPVQFVFNQSFMDEVKSFVDAAQGLTPCRATAEDGVILMKILDAIYESARTGHEVIL